jgi:hypothetical protein
MEGIDLSGPTPRPPDQRPGTPYPGGIGTVLNRRYQSELVTLAQVPVAHDRQAPVQASLQQAPSLQKPPSQSVEDEQLVIDCVI